MSAFMFAKTSENFHSSVQSEPGSWMTSTLWFVFF